MRRSRRARLLPLLFAAALVGAFSGRALTASIPSWATTRAGSGSQPFTAFTVSGVTYAINASSPQNVDSVSFTLGPAAATTVRVTLDGNVYSCTGTTSITCATTSPQAHASGAVSAGSLVVVAAQ
jgi:hypothetical protein